MDHYEETYNTWNKVAGLYQDKFMYLDIYNKTYDAFCAAVAKTGATILDVGCGPGNITRYLLSQRPDFNIHGVDIAPNMVNLAQQNNPAASFEVMDIRQVSKLPIRFDGIVCGFCLPYLSQTDTETFLKDCHTLLTDEGCLYISFVEGNHDDSGFRTGSSGGRTYFYYHERDSILVQLDNIGFREPRIDNVPYNNMEMHTVIIARKP